MTTFSKETRKPKQVCIERVNGGVLCGVRIERKEEDLGGRRIVHETQYPVSYEESKYKGQTLPEGFLDFFRVNEENIPQGWKVRKRMEEENDGNVASDISCDRPRTVV